MAVSSKSWKKLFLFCLGLAIAAGFCMKWMEDDLVLNNEKFTILGLELFYPKEKIIAVFSDLGQPVRTILRYHLSFDFAFMAGIYPGIAALCMIAREKTKRIAFRRLLFLFALLQSVAWLADILENYYLLCWIDTHAIGESDFALYHFIVYTKWLLALGAVLFAIPMALRKRRG